jgi:hypothetical protein
MGVTVLMLFEIASQLGRGFTQINADLCFCKSKPMAVSPPEVSPEFKSFISGIRLGGTREFERGHRIERRVRIEIQYEPDLRPRVHFAIRTRLSGETARPGR